MIYPIEKIIRNGNKDIYDFGLIRHALSVLKTSAHCEKPQKIKEYKSMLLKKGIHATFDIDYYLGEYIKLQNIKKSNPLFRGHSIMLYKDINEGYRITYSEKLFATTITYFENEMIISHGTCRVQREIIPSDDISVYSICEDANVQLVNLSESDYFTYTNNEAEINYYINKHMPKSQAILILKTDNEKNDNDPTFSHEISENNYKSDSNNKFNDIPKTNKRILH